MSAGCRPRTAVAVIIGAFIFTEVGFVLAMVGGPAFQRVFALSPTGLGLCLGAMPAGLLLASLVAGRLTERFGPYRVMRAGLAGALAAFVAVLLADNFPTLFSALAVAGVCYAVFRNAGNTMLTGLFPGTVRRIMSLASAMWFASSVLSAPLIGAWLAFAHRSGMARWSYGFPALVVAALLGGCLVAVTACLPRADPRSAPPPVSAVGASGTRAGSAWLILIIFCQGMMMVCFLAWANPMIQAVFRADDFRGSLGFSVFALGLAAGRLLLTWRQVAADDRALLIASGAAGGLCLAAALALPGYGSMLAAVGLGAFLASAATPCLFSLIATRFPRGRARMFGYLESTFALAGMVGPLAVGALVDAGLPVRTAMLLSPLGGLATAAAGLLWLFAERGRAGSPDAPPLPAGACPAGRPGVMITNPLPGGCPPGAIAP